MTLAPVNLLPPLLTGAARLLLGMFLVVHLLLAFTAGPTPVLATVVALVLVDAAAIMTLTVKDAAWTRGASAAVAGLAATSAAVVVPWLPEHGWPGYSAWPIGAATFIAMGLAIRQRVTLSWLLMAALFIVCIVWSVRTDGEPFTGVGLVIRQAGTLLLCTLFAIGLRRASRQVERFTATSVEREVARLVAAASQETSGAASQRVLRAAGPILERLRSDSPLNEGERAGLLVLEAGLRDDILLGPVRSDDLRQALDAARTRGAEILLLTDPGIDNVPHELHARIHVWIIERLQVIAGRAVLRLQTSEGGVRLSLRSDAHDFTAVVR